MATHKVPQDVEAEDKLLGPLSLKQLIFTILGLGFGYLTYFFFAKVHPLAAVLWVPFTLFFLILGLYQRKDQPAEVFLASAIQFYLTSKKRVWDQEGYEERVTITVPPKVDHQYTKNFTGEQAASHLSSLSTLMDSRGWTTKLAGEWQNPQLAAAASSDRLVLPTDLGAPISRLYDQQDSAIDVQNEGSVVAQGLDTRLHLSDTTTKQQALNILQSARASDDGVNHTQQSVVSSAPTDVPAQQQVTPMPVTPVSPAPRPTAAKDTAQEFTNQDGSVGISLR